MAHHKVKYEQVPHFSPHSAAKRNDNSTFLRKMVCNGISEITIASIHSEKTILKKLIKIMMIIITE